MNSGQMLLENGKLLTRDIIFTDFAQRHYDKQHHFRTESEYAHFGGMLEQDALAFPDINPAPRTVRHENDIGRYLRRESQQIQAICACRDNPDLVTFGYSLGKISKQKISFNEIFVTLLKLIEYDYQNCSN